VLEVGYENGVVGEVLYEPAGVPISRSKWETTGSVGRGCRGFGHSTRHKRVRVERGMWATRTLRWAYRAGDRRRGGKPCQGGGWCAKSRPCKRCHHTSCNAGEDKGQFSSREASEKRRVAHVHDVGP